MKPGARGQFTVLADGRKVFDKDEEGAFPDEVALVEELKG